jgi:hypothetical protein
VTKVQRPIIHGRDHEHGGADPIRIVWESVGSCGGAFPWGYYTFTRSFTSTDLGILRYLSWTFGGGDPLLSLADPTLPVVVDAGVYTYLMTVGPTTAPGSTGHAYMELVAMGSSGFAFGWTGHSWQLTEASINSIQGDATFVTHQNAGDLCRVNVNHVAGTTPITYSGHCVVQKLG